MRALGYPVVNLPGTPVRLLAWAIWRCLRQSAGRCSWAGRGR